MNKSYDWKTIEEQFIQSDSKFTLLGISLKYNIPLQEIQRYATNHQWAVKRLYHHLSLYGGRFEDLNWLKRRLRY